MDLKLKKEYLYTEHNYYTLYKGFCQMKKLSDQEKIDIVSRYQQGESMIKLSKFYGIARQSIASILKVRKVEIRNGK